MTTVASGEAAQVGAPCWCCGSSRPVDAVVHLGAHPEVLICPRCVRWLTKEAWELEDRARTGALVELRNRLRSLRREVVRRGWQDHPLLKGPIRALGRWLP